MIKAIASYFLSDIRPFHDDTRLQNLVKLLVKELNIKTFYETGTFRGDTLEWVIKNLPHDMVKVTVEKNRFYFGLNLLLMHYDNHTEAYRKDSSTMPVLDRVPSPVLFWLDAHWGSDPLTMELFRIRQWGQPCVIMIDDFQHPRRPLGFDEGINLSKVEGSGLKFYVPDYDAPRSYAVAFQNVMFDKDVNIESVLTPI